MSMYDCANCDEKVCSHTLAYMDKLEEQNKILKEALEWYEINGEESSVTDELSQDEFEYLSGRVAREAFRKVELL